MFWPTMLNRIEPNLQADPTLSALETGIVDLLVADPAHDPPPDSTLSLYFTKIAKCGYLAPGTCLREILSYGKAPPV